jgi:cell division protease FtsH
MRTDRIRAERKLPKRPMMALGTGPGSVLMNWKLIIPTLGVMAAALVAIVLLHRETPEPEAVGYTALVSALDAGRVAAITIRPGDAVRGRWVGSTAAADAHDFVTVYSVPDAGALAERAAGAGVAVTFVDARRESVQRQALVIGIQVLLFAGLGYLLFVQLRGQGSNTKIGTRGDGTSSTTFADVAGTQGAAEELREIVEFLKEPGAFTAMGAHVPKGVLLVGPPGTGKTLLARAVAGEAGVPFFHLSGSEVTGFIVGLGAHRIRSLFARARKTGGVIFFDELDSLGGARGRNRAHNEDDRTLNQLLVEMDGFAPSEGVVVVAATNRPEDLDPALRRPGRFDRTVTVGLPTVDGRHAILELHAGHRGIPIGDDVDFHRLARLTPGSSGAELANLINEAAIAAVREKSQRVLWSHFEIARDRMLLGKERVGFRAQESEWKIVAYHEAGHAIAGVVACPEDGLHKVTIQPRGRAMGVAHFAPDDDRHLHSRRYLEAQIIKGLGGRVAEEITFGAEQVTGGAESDLVHVNRVARKMVYRLGMGESAGLLVYEDEAPLSAATQAGMDVEVRGMLERLYAHTRDILSAHQPALEALAQALLERETLDGTEALDLLASHGVPVPTPAAHA